MQDLGDFFRRIPVPLYRTTSDGQLIAGNPALAEVLGFDSLEEMEKAMSPVESVYVDPSRRAIWLQRIETEGVVREFDVELQRADGTTIWVQDTARAVRDESGNIVYYDGALIDVTAKMAAERSRNEFIATPHELRADDRRALGDELAQNYDSFDDDERRELAALTSPGRGRHMAARGPPGRISPGPRGHGVRARVFDLVKAAGGCSRSSSKR